MRVLLRKPFLKGLCVALLLAGCLDFANAQGLTEGYRPPIGPYHGWYQPGTFHSAGNYLADYSNMNLDLSGSVDSLWLHETNGGASLNWSYGSSAPSNHNSLYFQYQALPSNLTVNYPDGSSFLKSGFCMDEWTGNDSDAMRNIAMEGLRAAKADYPDVFIAAWFTDTSPQLLQLAKEGTIDLLIYEGYQVIPNTWSNLFWKTKADSVLSSLRSVGLDDGSGSILSKTIYCHGFINGVDKDKWNRLMTPTMLEDSVKYIHDTYSEMPGLAFYQANSYYDPATIALINKANELCDTYYHRAPVPQPSGAGTDKAFNDLGIGLAVEGAFAGAKDAFRPVDAQEGNWRVGHNGAELNNFQEYTHHFNRSNMKDCVTLCVEGSTDSHGNVTVNTGEEVRHSEWPGDMHWAAGSVTLMMGDFSAGVQCPELLWTAPQDGFYDISALFTNSSGNPIDIEAIVLVNGVGGPFADRARREFDQWVTGYGASTEYSEILALSAGDTVGFLAYSPTAYALLGVDVAITATDVPEPASVLIFTAGAALAVARKRRFA